MSKIKFHKAESLPNPLNSSHDGIWFIADGENHYKLFVVTNGIVRELTVTNIPTLAQVLAVGNIADETGFGVEIIRFYNPHSGEYSYIYNEDGQFGLIASGEFGNMSFLSGDIVWEIVDDGIKKFKGLRGSRYYGENYDDNTYVQKKYVDDTISDLEIPEQLTAGEGIDITDDEISVKQATDIERGGVKIWKGTRSDYNAILTKNADTIYFIEDEIIPTIATFIIDKEHIISTTSSFVLSLDHPISTEIWDKVIDWKITWKDASGIHNLRDFVSKLITRIYLANRSTTGNFELSVEKNSLEPTDVTIPAGAKLILILEE